MGGVGQGLDHVVPLYVSFFRLAHLTWVVGKLPESMGDGLHGYDGVVEVGKYLSKES